MQTTVIFSEANGATVWSGEPTDVVVTDASYGQVWIWAPKSLQEAPDCLVLRGRPASSGAEPAEPVYQKVVGMADRDADACPYSFTFRLDDNDLGSALSSIEAQALTYSLVHYPGGGDEHGVVLFEGWGAGDVFRSDGTYGTSMANLVAIHAYLSDEVRITAEAAGELGVGGDLSLDPPASLAGDPLGVPFLAPNVPITTVADERRAWIAGGLAADTVGVPQATRDAIDQAETWIHVARRSRMEETTGEGAFEASHVGAWRVEDDGRYQFHVYADDAAPEDTPQLVGTPSPYVLLSAEWVIDRESSLYAHVAPYALPSARRAVFVEELGRGVEPGLTPLGFDESSAVTKTDPDDTVPYELHTPHARWVSEDRVWRWFLPDPLRVTARLAAQARIAAEQYGAWVQAAGPALQNAGLLSAMCFDSDHHRSHLCERLGEAGGFDMDEAWSGGASGERRPTTSTTLDHFRYGVEQQGAFLKRRTGVAGSRLEAWLATRHIHELSIDLVAGTLGSVPTETTEALTEVVFDGLLAATQAGSGGRLFAWALQQVQPNIESFEDLEAALDTFVVPDEATAEEKLGGSTFKFWFTAARSGAKLRAKLFAFSASAVVGLQRLSDPVALRGLDASARATALFAESIFGHAPAGGPPPPSADPFDRTRPLTTWEAGDKVQTYKAGPVRLVRKNYVASHKTTYAGWEVWEVTYDRAVDLDVWQGAGTLLNMMNAGLMGISIHEAIRAGDVGAQEGLDAAKIGVEIGRLVEAFGTARDSPMVRLSAVIRWAGPALDVAAGVLAFQAEVAEIRRVGAQRYADRDEVGMVGTACLVVGGALGVGAVVASGPVAGVLVALGVMAHAFGSLILWRRNAQLLAEQLSDDPLAPWVRDVSVWGAAGDVPSGVLDLARPGWEARRSVPRAEGLFLEAKAADGRGGGQTGAMVRTAYTFPVRVAVVEVGGALRVVLYVRPEYVPEAGTIAVSGSIANLTFAGVTADIRCVVHFAERSGSGFGYTVRPEGQPLPPNADPRALAAGWAPSTATGPTDRGGAAHELPVYLGDEWPTTPVVPAGLGASGPALSSPAAPVPALPSVADAVGRVAGREWAARVAAHRSELGLGEAVVWPGTRLDVDGLDAALGGGRFSVTGFAAFDPAVPFDPAPVVPDARPRTEDFIATQDIHGRPEGYRHPQDAR